MKWLRWRTHHSSQTTDWVYRPLFIEEESSEIKAVIEEQMQEKANEWAWSEHFHRVEWEIISTSKVPNKHIEAARSGMDNRIKSLNSEIRACLHQIPQLDKLIGKGWKTDPDEIEKAQRAKRIAKIVKERQAREGHA